MSYTQTHLHDLTPSFLSRIQTRLHDLAFALFLRKHATTPYFFLRAANLLFRTSNPSSFDEEYSNSLDALDRYALAWGNPHDAELCFRASLHEKIRTLPRVRALGMRNHIIEAERLLRAAVHWHHARMGLLFRETRKVVWVLAKLVEESGRCEEAGGMFLECFEGAKRAVGGCDVETREY
ncbi:hypothetical protein CC86DRAFT_287881 [Ophiobolus disseminans]|uniref:Uncharacterized protein n=1 Tax=Ophiobolus disseminans TaxID=1469910 RepID=A0A6A7A6H1_9PLEO|nr:hypothetical protein CC86DRAFT_287881 [Ophiobolus disseminans]